MDGKRKLRIVWGPHKWELRCNGMELMWREMAHVEEYEKGTGVITTVVEWPLVDLG
jgi:hypothetical protein